MKSVSSSTSLLLLFLSLSLSPAFLSPDTPPKGVDIQNPVLDVTPARLYGDAIKGIIFCDRVKVSGRSRLELCSYASSFRVTLAPSAIILEKQQDKIQVCFHRNASLGLCHCELDEWKAVQKGVWSSVMSPYEEKYVDVKFIGESFGSVAISVEEDSQKWRLLCLCLGFVLLLLAPVVSSWVPFYYSTSMAIGVFLVILILLFQAMKLVPTGKKNFLYLSIYGSLAGVGTYVLHHISMAVNSILINFGLNEEMHNPVYIFVIVGIVLAGAALGYWMVRKFVISKDGNVDVGVAQFVKWAMRIIGSTFIFQSTLDTALAMVVWVSSYAICIVFDKLCYSLSVSHHSHGSPRLHCARQVTPKHNRAEFLSRPGKLSPGVNMYTNAKTSFAWSNSPVKGLVSPSSYSGTLDRRDYYSTFHNVPKRRKYTKQEWEKSTRESTQQALAEWAGSPEAANWLIDNAQRIKLLPSDPSSEDTVGSESDSTDENMSASRFSLFGW